ncbi:hypothetical protein [Rubrivirga marina]|uniref:Uncharacterized protein n=1 Tax=Rubrivirga marina TaxID=1196024 RepID=A0A271J663_9BACT|nr:hypothetical protein [Rubrivirga marina]PAP78544.1 hypothetical protein BSZ37_19995 [Rubrivirga marina]
MENAPPNDTRVLLAASNPDLVPKKERAPEPAAADQLRGLDLLMEIAAESGADDLVDWFLDRRNEVDGED